MKVYVSALMILWGLAVSAPLSGATVWAFGAPGTSTVTFTKAPFADWTLPENQDEISMSVSITRQGTRGLYNPLGDVAAQRQSGTAAFVEGTLWAVEGFNGNPTGASFGAANHATLTFGGWGSAWNNAPHEVSRMAVVYLVAEDTYFDLDMQQWSQGPSGGGFSYTRAIPEVSSVMLVALGGFAGLWRRRRC